AALVIAGNDMGSGRETHGLVRALGIDPQTVFTGLLSGRDRLEALADATVVAYSSQDEIFGLVPLEALLSGTPVVVANDSGCGEVITATGGGAIVPVGDVDALTRAIAAVLADPARWRAEACCASTRVRALYGEPVVCAQVEAMYQELTTS